MYAVSRSRLRAALTPAPFLVMAGVGAVSLLAGPRMGALPLLVLGPAAAAVCGGPGYTALVGATADALCGGIDAYQHLLASVPQIAVFAAVLGVTAAAIAVSGGRQRRARELADVQTIADVAQRVLLRPLPGQSTGASPVQVAVRYISATSRARIGGDLYEVLPTRTGTRVIVGDVRGKGLPAVSTASVVLGAFREVGPDAPGLGLIAARIERSLARHLGDEDFVTVLLAEVSLDGAAITLLNCGHPPPLHRSRGVSRLVEPAAPGLPLGLGRPGDPPRGVTRVPFRPGDQLLLYTDGVSEARNRAGEFFPLERCRALSGGADPARALDALSEEVIRHVGHCLDDDAAMLLIRRPAS